MRRRPAFAVGAVRLDSALPTSRLILRDAGDGGHVTAVRAHSPGVIPEHWPSRPVTVRSGDFRATYEVERLFRQHGFDGPLLIAPPTGDDERVFVLPTDDYAALRDVEDLTQALQAVLHVKAWVVPASPSWPQTEPLR